MEMLLSVDESEGSVVLGPLTKPMATQKRICEQCAPNIMQARNEISEINRQKKRL